MTSIDTSQPDPTQPVSPFRRAWPFAALLAAGIAVYLTSFAGVFLLDDVKHIVENDKIRGFGSLWGDRPLVDLSLAVNYRLGGLEVGGYHAFNLVIHLLAGLTLFALVRRTLRLPRCGSWSTRSATLTAFTAALIWIVHPLNTQSVTYVVQRGESMMGLFYLLTIYGVLRGGTSRHAWPWYACAVCVCLLGMGSKAVMVTAPVAAILYDRIFLADSWAGMMRRRGVAHVGLAATGIMLLLTGVVGNVLDASPDRVQTGGLGVQGITPLEYAITQPGVILHYLKLGVWPGQLCFDYGWPIARTAGAAAAPMTLLLLMLSAITLLVRRCPTLGFPAVLVFLVLGPTSSVIPFKDAAVEHRMYLPLAALITLAVVGAAIGLQSIQRQQPRWPVPRLATIAVLGVATVFGVLTVNRNRQYHDALGMWENVLVRTDGRNARAHSSVGTLLDERGEMDAAMTHLREAIRRDPTLHVAHSNLGRILARNGHLEEAVASYRRAARLRPNWYLARNNLGNALLRAGEPGEGLAQLRDAVRLDPGRAIAHNNLGRALLMTGDIQGVSHLEQAVQLDPAFAQARHNLGVVLLRHGRTAEAIEHLAEATRLDPANEDSARKLAEARTTAGAMLTGVAE